MNFIKELYGNIISMRWDLGIFVWKKSPLEFDENKIEWIKNPYQDRWFADPFILRQEENIIFVLAEEFRYKHPIGRIAKLKIDISSKTIVDMKIILDLSTHLSFPAILRKDEKVYVYPENCNSGKQDIYEYDEKNEQLIHKKTICEDVIWDSIMTDWFGKKQLWTAHHDDYHLDIYDWNGEKFVFNHSIISEEKNSRMAGSLFRVGNDVFYPAQVCNKHYGEAVVIKKIIQTGDSFSFVPIKTFHSSHPTLKEGFHTFNVYNGMVIVDAHGYNYPTIGKYLHKLVKSIH